MTTMTTSKRELRGRDVLLAFIAFFLTVSAVDAVMITRAVSTFSGDTADAYRKGLAYNRTLQEEAAQNELGWTETRSFDVKTGRLSVSLVDRQQKPIDGLRVRAELGRAATNVFDNTFDLAPAGNGIYAADLSGLGQGSWTLAIAATERDETVFRSKARLWKQP